MRNLLIWDGEEWEITLRLFYRWSVGLTFFSVAL
jgi:hypothetical protein